MTDQGLAADDGGPLAKLHTRVIDVIAGYEELRERAAPELIGLARSMLALHERHRDALADLMAARGHVPDGEGSFMSLVQEGVIRVRSWFEDLDAEILPRIREGEEALVELYDDAIANAGARRPEHAALTVQRAEIRSQIAEMEAREQG